MTKEDLMDEEFPLLVLVDEDGVEHQFELLAELEIENDKYRVLVPVSDLSDDEDGSELEVVILKLIYDEEGNELLSDIEDDEEWEKVADAWQELVESEEV
jgi:uncharacterized protein YrzB (UPF0473 family)